jgi:hypothetical protein
MECIILKLQLCEGVTITMFAKLSAPKYFSKVIFLLRKIKEKYFEFNKKSLCFN